METLDTIDATLDKEKLEGLLNKLDAGSTPTPVTDSQQPNITGSAIGLGTEVGTGLALDKATAGLLVAPVPGSRLAYGAINFLGGAGSNIAAQRIRGEENINWGEVISSGLLGIIPFTSLRFGKKASNIVGKAGSIQRAAIGGAGMGVGDRFIQSGINEGQLPSPTDVAVGAVAGGTFGAGFQKSFDEVGKILTKYSGKTAIEINEKLTTRERSHLTSLQKKVLEVYQKGDPKEIAEVVQEFRRSQFNFEKLQGKYANYKDYDDFKRGTRNLINKLDDKYVEPTFTQKGNVTSKLIQDNLLIGKHRGFNWLKLIKDPNFTSGYKRTVAIRVSSTPYSKESYARIKHEDMQNYMAIYGNAMQRNNIPPSRINLDHRVTLVQSLGMYYNVPWGGKLFNDIQRIGLKRGYKPGNTRTNLELADPESHRLKTKFFNDLHGREGTGIKYWKGKHRNTGLKRTAIMEQSHTDKTFKGKTYREMHLEIVEDYYDEVDKGSEILDNALALWRAEETEGILPDQMVDYLSEIIVEDPEILTYAPERLQNLIEDVVRDFKDFPLNYLPKGNEGLEILGKRFPFLKGIVDPTLAPLDKLSVPDQMREIERRSGMTVGQINDAIPAGFDLKQLLRTIQE